MSQRKKLVVGNWKMELSYSASIQASQRIQELLENTKFDLDLVICPAYTVLAEINQQLEKSKKIEIGAQNVHWEERGAWTGEINVSQIKDLVQWCIVGHSERRALVGETDEQVVLKMQLLLKHGLTPIVCIGETEAERNQDLTVQKITEQARSVLEGAGRVGVPRVVIAYEPIWAIGTGVTPDPSEAAQTMLLVRKVAAEMYDKDMADRLRVMYGGSVKANTAGDFVNEPGVDGVLVGGASVRPRELVEIVKNVANVE